MICQSRGGLFSALLLVLVTTFIAGSLVYTGYVVFEEPTRTLTFSLEELLAGKKVFMREGDLVVFTSSLWVYNLSLEKSDGLSAKFSFHAPHGSHDFFIPEGKGYLFDLDGDGKEDFNVTFVRSEPTELEFWMQFQPPPKTTLNETRGTNQTNAGNSTIPRNESFLEGDSFDVVTSDLSTFQRVVRNKVQLLFISLCIALVLGITAALFWSYYERKNRIQEDIAFAVTPGARKAYDFG